MGNSVQPQTKQPIIQKKEIVETVGAIENKEPVKTEEHKEVDLVDKEGSKEKLEVYEEKEQPIKEEEIIQPKELQIN